MTTTDIVAGADRFAGRWTLDTTATEVTFRMRKLGVIAVSGMLPVLGGTVEVAPDGRMRRLEIRLDAGGFDTGNPARDADVRSGHFLAAQAHPEITYVGAALGAADGRWQVAGELWVRGRSTPVALVVEPAAPGSGAARMRAVAVVDRFALGIRRLPGVVGRLVHIEIDAAFGRAA